MYIAGIHTHCLGLALCNLQSYLAGDPAYGSFELTHSGFTSVARGDQFNCRIVNAQLRWLQTVFFRLPPDEIPLGNL